LAPLGPYRRAVLRQWLAIALGRLAGRTSRLLGRGGSAIPGLVAERVSPDVIERLAGSLREGVVLVTGTNGKTTTTKMLVSALQAAGFDVVTNRSGSNLERGIATALLQSASLRGAPRSDVAVFEADEAAARRLGPRLRPRLVIVTNLARDQLDRYGELDTAAAHVAVALGHAAGAVLNGDDPRVAGLGAGRTRCRYFGAVPGIRDLMPSDDELHGGPGPPPARQATDVEVVEVHPDGTGQTVVLATGPDRTTRVRLRVPGVYNAYNAAAAFTAAVGLGVDAAVAAKAMEEMEAPFGRGQVIEVRDRRVAVLLVKNPAGFNQAIRVLREAGPTVVLVAINDNHADGRDVSWLWDASVEELAATAHRFGCSGTRAADMALRFKYAGAQAWVEPRFDAALNRLVAESTAGDTVYVVPTYTALLALLDLLLPGVPRHEVWT
jgi:lipid II isoglutaminyl synthase (glutamine-hydrolysing)